VHDPQSIFIITMEPVETIIKTLQGTEIYFYYLKMKASIFIWVGKSPATLKELTVAMHLPVSAPLLIRSLYRSF